MLVFFVEPALYAIYSYGVSISSIFVSVISILIGRTLVTTSSGTIVAGKIYLSIIFSVVAIVIICIMMRHADLKWLLMTIFVYIGSLLVDLKKYLDYRSGRVKFYESWRFKSGIISVFIALAIYNLRNWEELEFLLVLCPLFTILVPCLSLSKFDKNIFKKLKFILKFYSRKRIRKNLKLIELNNAGAGYILYSITHSLVIMLPTIIFFNLKDIVLTAAYGYAVFAASAASQFSSAIFAHRAFNLRGIEYRENKPFLLKEYYKYFLPPFVLMFGVIIAASIFISYKELLLTYLEMDFIFDKIKLARLFFIELAISLSLGPIVGLAFYVEKRYILMAFIVELIIIIMMCIFAMGGYSEWSALIILISNIIVAFLVLKGQR
jgi:hypothetical protein